MPSAAASSLLRSIGVHGPVSRPILVHHRARFLPAGAVLVTLDGCKAADIDAKAVYARGIALGLAGSQGLPTGQNAPVSQISTLMSPLMHMGGCAAA